MTGPFKMKGSPMARNFGAPFKDARSEDPLTPVEKARREQKIMRSGTSAYEYDKKGGELWDKHVRTYAEHGRGAKSDRTRKASQKHGKIGKITRNYPK